MKTPPKRKKYTTIQADFDTASIIRDFCNKNGLVISKTTKQLWAAYMSGSIHLPTYKI